MRKVAHAHRAALAADIKAVLNASTLEWAHELEREIVDRCVRSHPKLAEWLETALEGGLACFASPAAHRRRIRNTNGLARFGRELKRRSLPWRPRTSRTWRHRVHRPADEKEERTPTGYGP